jgi:hypothetical protein
MPRWRLSRGELSFQLYETVGLLTLNVLGVEVWRTADATLVEHDLRYWGSTVTRHSVTRRHQGVASERSHTFAHRRDSVPGIISGEVGHANQIAVSCKSLTRTLVYFQRSFTITPSCHVLHAENLQSDT